MKLFSLLLLFSMSLFADDYLSYPVRCDEKNVHIWGKREGFLVRYENIKNQNGQLSFDLSFPICSFPGQPDKRKFIDGDIENGIFEPETGELYQLQEAMIVVRNFKNKQVIYRKALKRFSFSESLHSIQIPNNLGPRLYQLSVEAVMSVDGQVIGKRVSASKILKSK